jgi:hypothetical protein
MLEVRVENDRICIGKHFSVAFQRTLRIPDDDNTYPLPPGLGTFPICRVEDFEDRVPDSWKEHGGVFIPMYQREALWLSFGGAHWRPNAVKVAIGKINAITGEPWDEKLHKSPQDYIVCPDQPWLDGINAGSGYIRQFVAMPLGMGYTVEAQVSGKEEVGGVQFMVFDPKPGKFPEEPPPEPDRDEMLYCCCCEAGGAEMGLGAGGKMKQSIYPDEYGVRVWDKTNFGRVYVHIANSMVYREITGREPPPTPISARLYTEHGFPWFDLYDEDKGDLPASKKLKKVKSIKKMDKAKGFTPQQDDSSVKVPKKQVKKLGKRSSKVKDGNW